MNILVVCHYGLYQDLTFSFVHNQVREFAAMGHRVRVIIPNGLGKTGRDGRRLGKSLLVSAADGAELYDLRYVTLSAYGEKHFNLHSAVSSIRFHWKKLFRDFTPDVIHAHTLGFDSEIGAWLKSKFSCPLVVTTHGSDTAVPLANGQHDALRCTCDKADTVVAVSSVLREKLRTCGTTTRLEAAVNGFVPRSVPEGTEKDPFHMIQAGHLIPLKRTDVTIRAFAKLKKDRPQLRLTVIGQGPQREALENLCRELSVSDSVRFLGQIPNEEVFREMCTASYFVMASKPEGFGIVYLEAMAAGCVTVGTEGEGISDVIRHGENGFLVPADDPDAIVRVISDCLETPEKAANIAENGTITANKLAWENNAEKYLALFSSLRQTN